MHHNFIRGSSNDDENLAHADALLPLIAENRFRFLFHGHRHFSDMRPITPPSSLQGHMAPASPLTVFSTGSAGLGPKQLPEHFNQYQLLHFSPATVTVYMRRYDSQRFLGRQGVWQGDTSLCQNDWRCRIPWNETIRWFHLAHEEENKARETWQEHLLLDNPKFINLLAHSGASYLQERRCPGEALYRHNFFPGVPIRILLQNPRSITAKIRQRAGGLAVDQFDRKIPWKQVVHIYNHYPNVQIRFTDSVYCSLFFTDKGMFYDPYHLGEPNKGARPENHFVVGLIKPEDTH